MSRLDFVILGSGEPKLYRIRWGAPTLLSALVRGPEAACAEMRDVADATASVPDPHADEPHEPDEPDEGIIILDNIDGGCIVDFEHERLIVSGDVGAIGRDGMPRGLVPQQVLPALAATWPGWQLEYEHEHVRGALELYLHARGLASPAMTPIRCCAYALDTSVIEDGEPVLRERSFYIDGTFDFDSSEVAALQAAGFEEIRDLCVTDDELAARGITDELRDRIRDQLAGWFFTR